MKITLEIGQDAELRKLVLDLISRELKLITADKLKDLIKEQLSNINIANKIVQLTKEVTEQQIKSLMSGYGKEFVKELIESSINKWMSDNAESFIKSFISNKIKNGADSLSGLINSVNNLVENFNSTGLTNLKNITQRNIK